MRILQVFNHYRAPGGEATVVKNEAELLRRGGHEVHCLAVHNADLKSGLVSGLRTGMEAVWSKSGFAAMKAAIRQFSPDVVHVHNTFPILSPSVYWASAQAGIPVVKTLHNYRLTCASAMLSREGRPCEECVGRYPLPALRYRCYNNSFAQTLAVDLRNVMHRWLGTYANKIDAYIVLTEFARQIMMRAGLPHELLFVKPNFTFDRVPFVGPREQQIVFVGRIMREKGVANLLEAWHSAGFGNARLLLIGDGPERAVLEAMYASDPTITWAGILPHKETLALVERSRFLVLPSLVYEGMPMTVLEALCCGTPAIVPSHGVFPELISDRKDGFTFSTAQSLVNALRTAVSCSKSEWRCLSSTARYTYTTRFSESCNYERLIEIYKQAAQKKEATKTQACDLGKQMKRGRSENSSLI
jgi:glycosyltransferase involved in cell wall biosynthesis